MAWLDGTFYRPTPIEYDHPDAYGLRFEECLIGSTDGARLHGWFFPASEPAAGGGSSGTIVHCHGNAGNITAHFRFIAWLPAAGWNVLCFDYRGYGRSSGQLTRRGTIDDAHAALRFARGRDDVESDRIVLLGQSLGGAVGVVAAAEEDHGLAGICIDGAFAGYRSAARFVARQLWYTWAVAPLLARYAFSDDYAAVDYAAELPVVPKLFIAGTEDTIVAHAETRRLHDAASAPKTFWSIPGSGHTEALTEELPGGPERVLAFLNDCARAPGPGAAVARK